MCLASFTQHKFSGLLHIAACINTSVLHSFFHVWVICHRMYISQFVYPFIHWWTFGMHRNNGFFVFISNPAILLNSFISFSSFLWILWDFSLESCHLQVEIVLLLLFQFVCFLFLFLAWLFWLGLPGRCGIVVVHPGLVPYLSRSAFSLSPVRQRGGR